MNSRRVCARGVRKFNFPRVENNPCLGNWLLDFAPSRLPSIPSHPVSYIAIFCVSGTRKETPDEERNSLLIRPATWNKIKRILKLARANFLAFPRIIFVSLYCPSSLSLSSPALLFPYHWVKPPNGWTASEYSTFMRRLEGEAGERGKKRGNKIKFDIWIWRVTVTFEASRGLKSARISIYVIAYKMRIRSQIPWATSFRCNVQTGETSEYTCRIILARCRKILYTQ